MTRNSEDRRFEFYGILVTHTDIISFEELLAIQDCFSPIRTATPIYFACSTAGCFSKTSPAKIDRDSDVQEELSK